MRVIGVALVVAFMLAGCTGSQSPGSSLSSASSTAPGGTTTKDTTERLTITMEAWRDDMPGPDPRPRQVTFTATVTGPGHVSATPGAIYVRAPEGPAWNGTLTRTGTGAHATTWGAGPALEWAAGTELNVSLRYNDPPGAWAGVTTVQSAF